MPARNLDVAYVKCAMPAKVAVATKFVKEETGKYLTVNPESGRVNLVKTKLSLTLKINYHGRASKSCFQLKLLGQKNHHRM